MPLSSFSCERAEASRSGRKPVCTVWSKNYLGSIKNKEMQYTQNAENVESGMWRKQIDDVNIVFGSEIFQGQHPPPGKEGVRHDFCVGRTKPTYKSETYKNLLQNHLHFWYLNKTWYENTEDVNKPSFSSNRKNVTEFGFTLAILSTNWTFLGARFKHSREIGDRKNASSFHQNSIILKLGVERLLWFAPPARPNVDWTRSKRNMDLMMRDDGIFAGRIKHTPGPSMFEHFKWHCGINSETKQFWPSGKKNPTSQNA